jgi:hypothetical protein
MLVSTKRSSDYAVYIIESLRSEDDADGEVLDQILEMSGITSSYHNADTIEDFRRFIEEFKSSGYRYLHLSCHADQKGIQINGEDISNQELADLLKGALTGKRLFMSACKGANRDLANKVITLCGSNSLIGSPINLRFDKSVLFWPSFYHIMNEMDEKIMKRKYLISSLQKCTDLFNVPINYYSKIKNEPNSMRRLKVRPLKLPDDVRLTISKNKSNSN